MKSIVTLVISHTDFLGVSSNAYYHHGKGKAIPVTGREGA
jgi:hypothetical protein